MGHDILNGILEVSLEMAPWLVMGFLAAGLFHALLPGRMIARALGGRSVRTVLNATLLGIPLPLCSCGVIPAAASLRRRGAGIGPTLSFLIATPQTDLDTIFVAGGLIGWAFTAVRTVLSVITCLAVGFLGNLLPDPAPPGASNMNGADDARRPLGRRLANGIAYAFGELFDGIYTWLLLGVALAGVIGALLPPDVIARIPGGEWGQMLLMLAIGIPMYVCATGSVPVAAAFLAKGMNPGAALVFLLAGPATNVATVTMVARELGKRALIVYLGSLSIFSLIAGWLVNRIYDHWTIPLPVSTGHVHGAGGGGIFHLAGAGILGILVLRAICREAAMRGFSRSKQTVPAGGTITLRVGGMTCAHCVANVTKAVTGVTGVREATVDLTTGIVTIRPVEPPPSPEALRQAIMAAGYDVTA
ncbi:MAG: permease [Planctomycetota bacterium]